VCVYVWNIYIYICLHNLHDIPSRQWLKVCLCACMCVCLYVCVMQVVARLMGKEGSIIMLRYRDSRNQIIRKQIVRCVLQCVSLVCCATEAVASCYLQVDRLVCLHFVFLADVLQCVAVGFASVLFCRDGHNHSIRCVAVFCSVLCVVLQRWPQSRYQGADRSLCVAVCFASVLRHKDSRNQICRKEVVRSVLYFVAVCCAGVLRSRDGRNQICCKEIFRSVLQCVALQGRLQSDMPQMDWPV